MSDQHEEQNEEPLDVTSPEVAQPAAQPKNDTPALNGPDSSEAKKTYQRYVPQLMEIARAFGPKELPWKKKKS